MIDWFMNGGKKNASKILKVRQGSQSSKQKNKKELQPLRGLQDLYPVPRVNKKTQVKKELGSIIGDRVTKPQRQAMRKSPWADWDGDGVINGLDCAPKNRKKHMAWRYRNKIYPDIIDRSEELREEVKNKENYETPEVMVTPWRNGARVVTRLNTSMTPQQKKRSIALLETGEKVNPGMIKFLVDNDIDIVTGDKFLHNKNLDEETTGGIYKAKDEYSEKRVIYQPAMVGFGKRGNKDNLLTLSHELAHAKRDVEMSKKGLEPFNYEKPGWEEKKEVIIVNEKPFLKITHVPVSASEIEAEKYKARINKKMVGNKFDADREFFKEYRKIDMEKDD